LSSKSQTLPRREPQQLPDLRPIDTLAREGNGSQLAIAGLGQRAQRLEPWVLAPRLDRRDRRLRDLAAAR
jgi:hypothetical protein